MGKIRNHPPVKLIVACTWSAGFGIDTVYRLLEERLSEIESTSGAFDFSRFTTYYKTEMGAALEKEFIVFSRPEPPEILPALKLWTNGVEEKFADDGKRRINLDPGYVCEAKLVLATTKDYTHRLYLGEGIFGDVHLVFQNHTFNTRLWTYPDYQQPAVIEFFNAVREKYMRER
jgi:hypothetical protein